MLVLLPIHIVAAAVGLISGVVALSASKGGRLHRASGTVFAYAIFAMCATAVVGALIKGQAANVMAGSMTAYLAFTGLTTVRPPSASSPASSPCPCRKAGAFTARAARCSPMRSSRCAPRLSWAP